MRQKFAEYTIVCGKYICPNCGRQLVLTQVQKIISQYDENADYWYSKAGMEGIMACKCSPLEISISIFQCPKCLYRYQIERSFDVNKISKNDMRTIIPKKVTKHMICPNCGDLMTPWLRRVGKNYYPLTIDPTASNDISRQTTGHIIRYHLCFKCGHEIYPEPFLLTE